MDHNHLNNFSRGSPKDHLCEIISKLDEAFRSCHLSELLTDGRRTPDKDQSQKLTLSLCDRCAKNMWAYPAKNVQTRDSKHTYFFIWPYIQKA